MGLQGEFLQIKYIHPIHLISLTYRVVMPKGWENVHFRLNSPL